MERVLTGLRPFTPADYERLAALIQSAGSWPPPARPTIADITHRWARWQVQPESDVNVLPGPSGGLIAYSRATLHTEFGIRMSFEIAVDPEQRCRGIGGALYRLVEERTRNLGAPRMTASVYTTLGEGNPECTRFLETRGYYRDSTYWQLRLDNLHEQPLPEWPQGFLARSAQASREDAEKWAEMVRLNFNEPTTADRVLAQMTEPGSSPQGYFFAVEKATGREVGTSRGRFDVSEGRRVGYVATVSVLAHYQGRGLARALMAQTLDYLRSQGLDSATLFVEGRNTRARGLYEWLGWKPVYQATHYWKNIHPAWQLDPKI